MAGKVRTHYAESGNKVCKIRHGVLVLLTEPGSVPQAKIQLSFYPDMRLKTAEYLETLIYSTVLGYLQGRR